MKNTLFCFLLFMVIILFLDVTPLQNGLARTPPMGWLSWERFRCDIDCKSRPKDCISERLYMEIADVMASQGYKEAGYEYVNIDDCWSAKERDANLNLVADPVRFPHGIKALADYVHSKGLKIGIYGDMGTKTCGGYPGSKFTMEQDARTFAEWGIDSFKMDGCYSNTQDFPTAYPIMEFFLNKTGRPMLFSCSWPAYQSNPDYMKIAKYCNIWRNFDDIDDSWDSVKSIIQFYGDDKGNFSSVAGPGNFNDPDMIIIGDFGLSHDEERVQMAMWAIMAAPLFLSSDLRKMRSSSKALILNRGAIEINQDKLGIMGRRMWKHRDTEGWSRPVQPEGSYAIAILHTHHGGHPKDVPVKLSHFGIKGSHSFLLSEVFSGEIIGKYNATNTIKLRVNPCGVFFGKLQVMWERFNDNAIVQRLRQVGGSIRVWGGKSWNSRTKLATIDGLACCIT